MRREIASYLARARGFVCSPEDVLVVSGMAQALDLCTRLLEQGAPGLHFYTLNRAEATLAVWRNLGLAPAE